MRIHRPDRFIKAWRELEEASIPLEPEALSAGLERSYGLTMRHEPYSYDVGYVREIRRCRVAYMVPVFIRRDEPGKTIIRKCTLQSPWDDSIKWLVEDKEKNAGWYTFSEESYPRKDEYPRDMILNHQMIGSLRHGTFERGCFWAWEQCQFPTNTAAEIKSR